MNEQASPTRIGVAVGLGVLVGCSPLWSVQMLLALALAQAFRLNKLGVLAGVQISAPPHAPLVVYASIQLGNFMLHGTWLSLWDEMKSRPLKDVATQFLAAFALGGMTLGVVLGLLFGWLAASIVRRKRAADLKQPPLTYAELDALHDRLRTLPPRFRHYGTWKVRLDPIYPLALFRLGPRKEVLDLGAGMGLLGALFHARFPDAKVRCVEWDAAKADVARQLLKDLPAVQVEQGDAREAAVGAPDAICLFDVLHYSPIAEQRAWVTKLGQALAPGGMLLVRELDPERGRWGLAEKIEKRAVAKGWNQGAGVHAWPISELAQALRDLGLVVEVHPAGKGLFSANALVVATKAAAA